MMMMIYLIANVLTADDTEEDNENEQRSGSGAFKGQSVCNG